MLKEEIKKLAKKLDDIEERFSSSYDDENENGSYDDEFETLETEVYEIEDEIATLKQIYYYDDKNYREFTQLDKLSKRIQNLKREHDFYDEDAVLDMMFPDRHDEDFDEDSISYSSVFGND